LARGPASNNGSRSGWSDVPRPHREEPACRTAAAAADAAPAPKGKKKLIIIIAAAVLLLGGGGGAALMLMKKKPVDEEGGEEAAQVEGHAKPKAAAAKHDPKHPPVFAPLDPFTVNLADRETERYAQVALTLELDDPKTATVKAFMPAIRNNILMVLAHKTSAQILGAEGKTKLARRASAPRRARSASRSTSPGRGRGSRRRRAEEEEKEEEGRRRAADRGRALLQLHRPVTPSAGAA
jgi:flagellar FliL protein